MRKLVALALAFVLICPLSVKAQGFVFRDSVHDCDLADMSPAVMNAYGKAFAAQMLGQSGAAAQAPDMTALNAEASKCAQQGRLTRPEQAKALSDNLIDRLALRWAQMKLSADTGLPLATVRTVFAGLSTAERADIDDSGVGEKAGNAIEAKITALLGRAVTDPEVDLLSLAFNLYRRIEQTPAAVAQSEAGTLPFYRNGHPSCAVNGSDLSVAVCKNQWGWPDPQSEQAKRYGAAQAQLEKAVQMTIAAVKAQGGKVDMTSCGQWYSALSDEKAIDVILFGVIPVPDRPSLTRIGGSNLNVTEAAARKLSQACTAGLGTWAAKPENQRDLLTILRAIARRDAAEAEFDRLSPGL